MPKYATDAHQWMQDNASKLARIRDTAERTREAIESIRGRAASHDGSVEAVVSASGDLESLQISRSAMTLSPEVLASTLMETIRSARDAGTADLRQALTSQAGDRGGMDVLEVLGVGQQEPQAPTAETRASATDDDAWNQRSILRRA